MFNSKIVITGMGIVSPLGSDFSSVVSRLSSGESGVVENTRDEFGQYVGFANDYEPNKFVPKKKIRRMETVNHFSINAVGDALEMADIADDEREDVGVLVGTGFAGIESVVKHQKSLHEDKIQMLRPVHFPTTVYNATAGLIAIEHKLKGINSTITGIDLPSEYAFLYALINLQKSPDSKVVVVGGDASSTYVRQGLNSIGFLDRRQRNEPRRMFEQGASGITMGEGAVALVLETEASANARGANIIARVDGIQQSCTGDRPFSYDRSPESINKSVKKVLAQSNATLSDIDLVSLSANGSPQLDIAEQAFICDANADIPVRSLCDQIGAFPGGGLVRLSLALAAMREGKNIGHIERNTDINSQVLERLTQPVEKFDRLLHVGTGLGGNSMAMDLRVG